MNSHAAGEADPVFACHGKNKQGAIMSATGELIRHMNYIDDIATTLRRISASIPAMTREEAARLGEYIRKSEPSYESVVQRLEKAGKETKEEKE
jgi:uncharacterized protein Yka (UPF0111/DUF47 family)